VPPRELGLEEEPELFGNIRVDLVDVCDFALKSGWRQGEVFGLRWSDCDLQTMQATTRIKGGDVVKRPLTPTLVAIIANQPKVGPFVFTYVCQKSRARRKAGERYPVTKTSIRGAWAAAKKAANVEGFRFHDLRHTRGTRIVRATGSLAAAKEALKHRRIETTLRYAHVLDGDVRRALDASEKARKTAKNDA
jgi:integrase